ncbi:predicted protease [Candidatus Vecturithrix granuli]|uniref:Predicted protease n=1 Tax=Vecturithrix granuli TaxID=1499967 RepID=A0A081C5W4_VECG1|nr:predicted protease [Candidatus Vecturithrix granuli]
MSESTIITCRFCQAKNRIPFETVFHNISLAKCGKCHEALFVAEHAALSHLSSRAYEHRFDTQAMESIKKIPGVDSVLKTLIKESYERANRLFHKANTVAVTPKQLPHLYQLFLQAAYSLAIENIPDLYVLQSPIVTAYTTGVEKPFVVVTSGLLDLMTDDELVYVLGHELGHWQANHVLYKMASRLFSGAASALAEVTFGLGRFLTTPLQLALLQWDRCSELTADRAGLLAVRKVDVAICALMKLAGGSRSIYEQMDYQEFIRQAEDFQLDQDDSTLNKVYVLLQVMYQSHPFPVWRTSEILTWVKHGDYLQILSGQYSGNYEEIEENENFSSH